MTDRELLARLIQCEAGGEGDVGMRAVATVVMNRVRTDYGEYGRFMSIPDVVFAPRQFECATHPTQNIYNMQPGAEHYAIADWAIGGERLAPVGEALWFYAPMGADCRPQFPGASGVFAVKIGGHCFFVPTAAYAQT